MIGYIFAEIEPGRDKEALEKFKAFDEVVEAHLVTGEYNSLLVVNVPTLEDLDRFVMSKLRAIRDVTASHSLVSVAPIKV